MKRLGITGDGWLQSATRARSPNCDRRPRDAVIKLVVIHGISLPPGEYGGGQIVDFFCNRLDCDAHPYFDGIRELRVSAHCLIDRAGDLLQLVSFDDRAWHAGESEWRGEAGCNDFSVGIELEGCDDDVYTDAQYRALAMLIDSLRACYPAIGAGAVVGHSDIAPGRKTDPGPNFDWQRLRRELGGDASELSCRGRPTGR